MSLFTLLALAVGLAMDAFAVAVSCGLAFDRRHHAGAARIALSFGGFQALMPMIGWAAGFSVRQYIESWDHWLAFALLLFLGVHMLVGAIKAHRDGESLKVPGQLRLLALSLATSIDALAVGLTLALIGVSIYRPALVIGVVTFATSWLGIALGHELERLMRGRLKRDVQVLGGLVLVGIGVHIVVQHTIGP